ncbi:hypothetical protein XENOCAPTIV_007913 [Xenoophorus captivus]|uniref:Uncharacterized protein n=1 Tax=Xenoophorus captivus TaxID=1517983 RepID=A0ABV0R3B5_9TELE
MLGFTKLLQKVALFFRLPRSWGLEELSLPAAAIKHTWEEVLTSAMLYLFLTVTFGCHTRNLEELNGGGSDFTGKFSLFVSVISRLYDDSVAQNYSNIENMNTSLLHKLPKTS